jgi:hypothetical protein
MSFKNRGIREISPLIQSGGLPSQGLLHEKFSTLKLPQAPTPATLLPLKSAILHIMDFNVCYFSNLVCKRAVFCTSATVPIIKIQLLIKFSSSPSDGST